jgi:uncharacterized SAM-binding protein YcdF (DUF218 family)
MSFGFFLRILIKALILPPASLLVMIGLGAVFWARRPKIGATLVAGGAIALWGLSLPVVADSLAESLAVARPLDPSRAPRADFIVVLSGGVRPNTDAPDGAELRGSTLARVAEGAALSRQSGVPLVLSGGSVDGGPVEARVMEAVLERNFGLHALFLEESSRTTRENALETARWARAVGFDRLWLVTSATHMGRAVREFEAAGMKVTPAPVPGPWGHAKGAAAWLPHPQALEESHAVLYEWVGDLVAELRPRG